MKLDTFAIKVYQQPDVADACLTLQETVGLDVPILLYCAWFGLGFGEMTDGQLSQVVKKSTLYASCVVKPLRQTRRWMKDAAQSNDGVAHAENQQSWQRLREQIKAIEISSELLWLEALESMTAGHGLRWHTDFNAQKLVDNMRRYCLTMRTTEEMEALDALVLLSRIADRCETVARQLMLNEQHVQHPANA